VSNSYLDYTNCTLEYLHSNNGMINEYFSVEFLVVELSTHKNNFWVSLGNHGTMYWKDGRKDYRPTQLSKDGYSELNCIQNTHYAIPLHKPS